MYELVQAGPGTYYINCPSKIGIIKLGDADVCLIDSGSDKDAGRKVRQILDKEGWRLHAIINTHSNADHIGGNRYLQQQSGCRIYACGMEAAFTRSPILEPSFLYGGYPFKELRHKFLMAQGSDVCDISEMESDPALKDLELISLPGHFFQMMGVRTRDDAVFLADCLCSGITLEKYHIPFIYDVAAYLETLDMVADMKASIFIPAHAGATDSIRELAMYNKQTVLDIAEYLLSLCTDPMTFEAILKCVFDHFDLVMTFEQHVLVGSTIRSFLSWLKDAGRLNACVAENRILWSV